MKTILSKRHLKKQMIKFDIFEYEILKRLKNAKNNHELEIYFQPIYNFKEKKIIGAEALMRWPKDEKKIPIQTLIEISEKYGFIVELDKYIFERVCMYLKQLKNSNIPTGLISINVSRMTTKEANIEAYFESVLSDYGLDKNDIELEVTERMTGPSNNMDKIIERLSTQFPVSIDDFGIGCASISLLSNPNIRTFKIAREFIEDDSEAGRRLLKNIIRLVKDAKFMIIVEGVETREQLDFLEENKCYIIQGYYHSKPMSFDSYKNMLKKQMNEQ